MFYTFHFGQSKSVENFEQVWLAYFNQTRFSKRWGMWVDIQLRTKENFVEYLSQFIEELVLPIT
jgi:prephenate dehydrogenase